MVAVPEQLMATSFAIRANEWGTQLEHAPKGIQTIAEYLIMRIRLKEDMKEGHINRINIQTIIQYSNNIQKMINY